MKGLEEVIMDWGWMNWVVADALPNSVGFFHADERILELGS
jgi:hypothetical protein